MADNNNPRQPKKGLKLNNANSSVVKPLPPQSIESEKQASIAFAKDSEYKNRFRELSVKMKAIMEDTVLVENKSIISKDLEKETATKLIMLANEMDEDESQPNVEGTRGIVMLLIRCMMIQRDSINSLAHKVFTLEQQIKTPAAQ
jgi:hypothetical protein